MRSIQGSWVLSLVSDTWQSKNRFPYLTRRIVFTFGCILLVSARIVAAELTPDQVREFEARHGVVVFAPVTLQLNDAKYELLKGAVTSDGGCKFQQISQGKVSDLLGGMAEASIDIAVDYGRCEKVVITGYLPMDSNLKDRIRELPSYLLKDLMSPVGSNLKARILEPPSNLLKDLTSRRPLSDEADGTDAVGPSKYMTSSEPVSPDGSASASTEQTLGVYVSWDDGKHPVMQFFDTSIMVNYGDSKVTYEKPICDPDTGELRANGSTLYFYNLFTGWQVDKAEVNDYGSFGPSFRPVCIKECGPSGCSSWYGSYTHKAELTFSNSIFPGCGNGVLTHYDPSKIYISSSGEDYTITANTYLSGQFDGCGEYLRSKVLKYAE
jgi:hypothetical protein